MPTTLLILLVGYLVLLGLDITAAYPTKLEPHRLLFKTLTSLGFVTLAAFCTSQSGAWWFFAWMAPAFLACLVGDVLLAKADNHWSDALFTAGVAAFAVAHLVFLVALSHLAPFHAVELIFPAIVAIGALFIDRIPGLDVGKMKPALVPYGFLVTWLFSKTAVWLIAAGASTLTILATAGALLFLTSDALLLFIYFYQTKFKPMKFLNQATYYLGMACLAILLLFV